MKDVLCEYETRPIIDITSPEPYQIEINIRIDDELFINRLSNKYGDDLIITLDVLWGNNIDIRNKSYRNLYNDSSASAENHFYVNFFNCLNTNKKNTLKFNSEKELLKRKKKLDQKLAKFLANELSEYRKLKKYSFDRHSELLTVGGVDSGKSQGRQLHEHINKLENENAQLKEAVNTIIDFEFETHEESEDEETQLNSLKGYLIGVLKGHF